MRLASVIPNNVVQNSIKPELWFLKASQFSPSYAYPKLVRLQLTSCFCPSYPGRSNSARRYCDYSAIACKAEQDGTSSTSEGELMSPPSNTGIRDINKSHVISSIDDSQVRKEAPKNYATSVKTVALCVLSAVAFGVGLGLKDGVGRASEFFAGYLLEQSLSVDNLFVFVLIFKYFKVPLMYQNRVLSYGIAGAIFFRLSLILLGTATLQRFEGVNLLFAAVLLYSSFKLFADKEEDSDLSDNFIVKTCQKFIPITSSYDENRFITVQDGVWKASNILGRPLHCF